MSLDPTELFVGQTGSVYIGDVGATFPTIEETVGGDWTEIGYVDTDGIKFNFPKPFTWIRGWQSRHPIRGIKGDPEDVVGLNLQQWNPDTMILAFGGGSFVDGHYSPPDEEVIAEVAFLVEGRDGDDIVRFGAARCVNQAATTFTWARSAESKLPIELMILASDEDEDWFFDFSSDVFAGGS